MKSSHKRMQFGDQKLLNYWIIIFAWSVMKQGRLRSVFWNSLMLGCSRRSADMQRKIVPCHSHVSIPAEPLRGKHGTLHSQMFLLFKSCVSYKQLILLTLEMERQPWQSDVNAVSDQSDEAACFINNHCRDFEQSCFKCNFKKLTLVYKQPLRNRYAASESMSTLQKSSSSSSL